jgi:Tfp pilus assembly protein PilV
MASSFQRQRGATLIEALVAFLVVTVGMLAMTRVQVSLRLNTDIARQRSEAVRLAQQDMEQQRAITGTAASPAFHGVGDATDSATTVIDIDPAEGESSSTRYRLTRAVEAGAAQPFKTVTVAVDWTDRTGTAQQFRLSSVVGSNLPALTAALTLPVGNPPARSVLGRSLFIPRTAKDLGDGRSALKPRSDSDVAWVFDNASGTITAQCSGLPTTLRTQDMGAGHLHTCSLRPSLWLGGVIRFSLGVPAVADAANDTPLPTDVVLRSGTGGQDAQPICVTEAMKVVAIRNGSSWHREQVSLAAQPASLGHASWTELGERFTAYHCAIPIADTADDWAIEVIPDGWHIGHASGEHTVCRFIHQGQRALMGTLGNFLVVRADQPCPAASAPGASHAHAAENIATVQHQP